MNLRRSLFACAAIGLSGWTSSSAQSHVTLVTGAQGVQWHYTASQNPDLSADGRFLAFDTTSDAFSPLDTNTSFDVYVFDRLHGTFDFISVTSAGVPGDQPSSHPSISDDGRFVAFDGQADNLGSSPDNGTVDVFVKDRVTGVIEAIHRSSSGVEGNLRAWNPVISGDGRYVVYESDSTNLVPNDVEGQSDVFVFDRSTGITQRVSETATGVGANSLARLPKLSFDGRFIVFESAANNLVFGDTNGGGGLAYDGFDVFRRDLSSGAIERVSLTNTGTQAAGGSFNASISGDGHRICFVSRSSDLVAGDVNASTDTFVRDTLLGTTVLASVGTGGVLADARCEEAEISGDGTKVYFSTRFASFVPADTNELRDIYVRDLAHGTTALVTMGLDGTAFDSGCYEPSVSADGRVVAFRSNATAFGAGLNGGTPDVFVAELANFEARTYCTAKLSSVGCSPAIGATGIASVSHASGFVLLGANLRASRAAQFFYGTNGPNNTAFQGGTLCVRSPVARLPAMTTSGPGAAPCDGEIDLDFNERIHSGADPALVAGTHVWAQLWSRDDAGLPGFEVSLTDALEFAIDL